MKDTYNLTKDIIYSEVLLIKEKPEVIGKLLKKHNISSICSLDNDYTKKFGGFKLSLVSIKKEVAIIIGDINDACIILEVQNYKVYETTLAEIDKVLGGK